MRPTLEQIYMDMAISLAKRSKCSKKQVGCVITTHDMRSVSGIGYNGHASGNDLYKCTPETCECLHAENNAVINSNIQDKNKIFFVTLFPCKCCTIQIINSGCSKLYYHEDYKKGSKHWKKFEETKKLLEDANIEIHKI